MVGTPMYVAPEVLSCKPYNHSVDAYASATCCTSDITLAEFKTLCGKMDASDSSATTVEG